MLQTDQSWECYSTLGAIFNQPSLRSYRFVEVALNLPLFHLDAILFEEAEGGGAWSRFICSQLTDVLEIIRRDDTSNVRISIQTPRNDDGYKFFSIAEIIEGRSRLGDMLYIFLGANGERYVHSLRGEGISDMLERRIVWSRGQTA
jgi:hypothetical protein